MQLQNCKKNDKGNKRLRRPGTIRRHPDRTQRFLRPRQNTAKTLRKKEIPLLYPLPAIRKIHSQMLPPGPGQTLAECRRSRKISCKDQSETILPEIRPGSGLCRTPHPPGSYPRRRTAAGTSRIPERTGSRDSQILQHGISKQR